MKLLMTFLVFTPMIVLADDNATLSTQGTSGAFLAPVSSPWTARGPYVTPLTNPTVPTLTLVGHIAAVDPAFNRFTLATTQGTLEWPVSTNTPVTYHFVNVGVQGLRPGDPVRITYNVRPSYIISVEKL
jgi:hypothetical protein